MVWAGRHASILAEPGMLEHTVAAYTFSKSYSMSGWRIGFAVAAPEVVEAIGKLINTTASCSPPLGPARRPGGPRARHDDTRRVHGAVSRQGRAAVRRARPASTVSACRGRPALFTSFPDVRAVCNRLRHHVARPGALPPRRGRRRLRRGLPGRRMLRRGRPGFLRFSCAEPDDRIDQAIEFHAAGNRAPRPCRALSPTHIRNTRFASRYLEARSDVVRAWRLGEMKKPAKLAGPGSITAPPESLRESLGSRGAPPAPGRPALARDHRPGWSLPTGTPSPTGSSALVRSIVSQQISSKAARSINLRLLAIGRRAAPARAADRARRDQSAKRRAVGRQGAVCPQPGHGRRLGRASARRI